jgi:hypothetical protein
MCLSFFQLLCLAPFLSLSGFLYKIDGYYYATAFFYINFIKIYPNFLYRIYSIIFHFLFGKILLSFFLNVLATLQNKYNIIYRLFYLEKYY